MIVLLVINMEDIPRVAKLYEVHSNRNKFSGTSAFFEHNYYYEEPYEFKIIDGFQPTPIVEIIDGPIPQEPDRTPFSFIYQNRRFACGMWFIKYKTKCGLEYDIVCNNIFKIKNSERISKIVNNQPESVVYDRECYRILTGHQEFMNLIKYIIIHMPQYFVENMIPDDIWQKIKYNL